MERSLTRDILSGMFIVSTKASACVVDTVMQVSSSKEPLISVSVNKNNYTNECLKKNQKFIISILSKNVDGNIIKTFGFSSSRDTNKFKDFEYIEIDGIKVLKDVVGYMVLEIVDVIDVETHDIFIGRLVSSQRFNNDDAMLYQYYQEHKDELLKVTTKNNQTAFVCTVCGYVYYGDTLPPDFKCPKCGVGREAFEKR